MLDLSHIPNSQQDIKVYYANSGSFGYQTWAKPRKCNFIYILSIDGGGGGTSGTSTLLNSNTVNNSGGGSGGVARAIINANLVPDTLYIKVGKGGIGGASTSGGANNATAATSGESSGVFVSSYLSSQANAAQGVSLLGGSVSTNGGSGPVVATGIPASSLANSYLLGLTNIISLAGISSAGFNTLTQPSDISPLTSQIVMAGGAGAPYNGILNGAGIAATSISPLIPGGIGGTTLGGNGADGYTSWKPFFSTGGAGGGNATTAGGVAGNGGNGGIGCGGGAGGNANAGTSGKGGNGGDGLVVIISF
jgi:hypothetical protein